MRGYDALVAFGTMFRVWPALFVTVIYAAFASMCGFVWWRFTIDPARSGAMMPDDNQLGRIMVIVIVVFAALLGAFVALCVSLTESRKLYGALFGGGVGLVIFLMYLASMLKTVPSRYHSDAEIMLALVLCFVAFPVGLMLTAIATSALASRGKRAG
ncbi:MAG TPA: hypothetical protein VFM63_00325 [Pyrinomonadaceae bacterium]|nr:hypothetical protein [Pyrinomonadaceae bacterium]